MTMPLLLRLLLPLLLVFALPTAVRCTHNLMHNHGTMYVILQLYPYY